MKDGICWVDFTNQQHAKKRAVFKTSGIDIDPDPVGWSPEAVGGSTAVLVGQQQLVGHQTVGGSPEQLDVRIDRDLRHLPGQPARCGHAGLEGERPRMKATTCWAIWSEDHHHR